MLFCWYCLLNIDFLDWVKFMQNEFEVQILFQKYLKLVQNSKIWKFLNFAQLQNSELPSSF